MLKRPKKQVRLDLIKGLICKTRLDKITSVYVKLLYILEYTSPDQARGF